jgi:hypothetical protein
MEWILFVAIAIFDFIQISLFINTLTIWHTAVMISSLYIPVSIVTFGRQVRIWPTYI